jgi:hypothetical protein
MKKLRLTCDYFCYPIWHDDGKTSGEFGDIDPRTLPISPILADELIAWSDSFDRGLNMEDPGSSQWAAGEREEFLRVGWQLLPRLQDELGSGFAVRNAFDVPVTDACAWDSACFQEDTVAASTSTGAFARWWWFLLVLTAVLSASLSFGLH